MDDAKLIREGAVVLVNVFTPKPGRLDAFCEAQIAEYKRLRGQVDGALGNRLLKSSDGSKAVNIAYFASRAQYDAWRESDLFKDHFPRIEPFVEKVEPGLYQVVYETE